MIVVRQKMTLDLKIDLFSLHQISQDPIYFTHVLSSDMLWYDTYLPLGIHVVVFNEKELWPTIETL